MSWYERRITKELKKRDAKLYVHKNYKGVLQVMRESYAHHPYLLDDCVVYALVPTPHFIFALTDNWTASGKACEWGVEPVLKRLTEIDTWNDHSFVNKDLEKHNKKVDESKAREVNNKIESAVYESHRVFKKTFADINTANMAKIDKRRKKGA